MSTGATIAILVIMLTAVMGTKEATVPVETLGPIATLLEMLPVQEILQQVITVPILMSARDQLADRVQVLLHILRDR